jgi:acetyl-CoA carboxylase carboxyltransferase component
MGGQQAAATLLTVRMDALRGRGAALDPAQQDAFKAPILAQYEHEGSPYYSTARLWDDGVIDPADTRRVLALGIAAALNAPIEETHHGVFRM